MRIAQISTVETPVLREGGDSIEHMVWVLTDELTKLGHEVTVFATAGSDVNGRLVATLPGPLGQNGSPLDWRFCEVLNLTRALERSGEFDVLHSHAYLWGVPFEGLSRAPIVHTLHVTPYDDVKPLLTLRPSTTITAISHCQWSAMPWMKPFAVVHHGVETGMFTLREKPDDYVCYLGRFIPDKGPLAAIAAARTLGVRLVMAGPESEYFSECIAPHVDGKNVEYVGRVNAAERDRLLGGARAFLYPVEAAEPFGLVQIEAMLCGTPVVAMRLGAVAEIVDEGVTGFSAESPEEFVKLIPRAFELDRRRVRETAERRFSSERMAREYVAVYERVMREAARLTITF